MYLSNNNTPRLPTDSPCIGICKMNPITKLCEGCQRTIEEIAAWSSLSEQEKITINERLERNLFGD